MLNASPHCRSAARHDADDWLCGDPLREHVEHGPRDIANRVDRWRPLDLGDLVGLPSDAGHASRHGRPERTERAAVDAAWAALAGERAEERCAPRRPRLLRALLH